MHALLLLRADEIEGCSKKARELAMFAGRQGAGREGVMIPLELPKAVETDHAAQDCQRSLWSRCRLLYLPSRLWQCGPTRRLKSCCSKKLMVK